MPRRVAPACFGWLTSRFEQPPDLLEMRLDLIELARVERHVRSVIVVLVEPLAVGRDAPRRRPPRSRPSALRPVRRGSLRWLRRVGGFLRDDRDLLRRRVGSRVGAGGESGRRRRCRQARRRRCRRRWDQVSAGWRRRAAGVGAALLLAHWRRRSATRSNCSRCSRNSTSLARIAGSIALAARVPLVPTAPACPKRRRHEAPSRASSVRFDLGVRRAPVGVGRDQLVEVADQLLHLLARLACQAARPQATA